MTDRGKPFQKAEEAEPKAVAKPVEMPTTIAVPHEVYRTEQYGKAQAEAATLDMDETVPGGRYLLSDGKTVVDADGKQVTGDHKGEYAGTARGTSESMVPPAVPSAGVK